MIKSVKVHHPCRSQVFSPLQNDEVVSRFGPSRTSYRAVHCSNYHRQSILKVFLLVSVCLVFVQVLINNRRSSPKPRFKAIAKSSSSAEFPDELPSILDD
ncbi:hypothetical protein AVEN_180447-1 [Araneus ventricosus]|uniref:Transmembrane protein n=1 Tax=Araneus ventricosus TaxID=182803 RepID=A0A4Y2GLY5_ARAVE|nr:hypothetical protein AVEN_180447-1 [Araneus ventricosus]